MNTRLLRMGERPEVRNGATRYFPNLGQMQPVIIGHEGARGVTLRIEGVVNGRPCWHVLPLPRYRKEAKRLFGQVEFAKVAGVDTPASAAWKSRAAA